MSAKPLEAHPSVVCTVLEDGGVLLHLETKYYYSLNRVGLALWLHLESGYGRLAEALAARFPHEAGRDEALDAFLAELERERLATGAGALTPGGAAPGGGTMPPLSLRPEEPWAAPRLTRHEAPLNQILSNPFDPCVPLAE